MADVSKRARDAAGAAADRLRKAVEGSPLGNMLEEQQHNLNELLEQVQNTELRAKLTAIYDQQQKTFVDLAHTLQANVNAQQQHLTEVLTAVEETLRARRAKVEEADLADDLSDDLDVDEPPRAAPFADVPAAKSAAPAPNPPPASPTPPAAKKATAAKKSTAKKAAPPPTSSTTPTPPAAKKAAKKAPAKKATAKKATKKAN